MFCENGLIIAVRALVLLLETNFLLTTQKLATFHKKKCCQSLRLGSRDIFFIPPKKFEKYRKTEKDTKFLTEMFICGEIKSYRIRRGFKVL